MEAAAAMAACACVRVRVCALTGVDLSRCSCKQLMCVLVRVVKLMAAKNVPAKSLACALCMQHAKTSRAH